MKYAIVVTFWTWIDIVCGVNVEYTDTLKDPRQLLSGLEDIPTDADYVVVSVSFSDDLPNPFIVAHSGISANGKETE